MEAYIRGLERLVEGGGDPSNGRVGRELLRLARRHRGRQAARGDRQHASCRASSRSRTRSSRTSTARRSFSGARWEALAAKGATEAAVPLGVDLDEEPGLPRRALRRGADRPGHREHDAARRRSRRSRTTARSRRHARAGLDEAERLFEQLARGRRRLRRRRRRRSRARACRSSSTRSTSCSTASARSAASWHALDRRRASSSSGSGSATRPSGPAHDEARWLGWLDEPRADARARRPDARRSPTRSRARSTTSCCSGWAARRSRPRCCGSAFGARALPRPRHDAPGGDPRARRLARPRAHAVRRLVEVGRRRSRRARTSTSSGKRAPRGRQCVAITDPGSALEQLAREREFARLRRRADDRRPLLGAVAVRARARGADRRRPRPAARARRGDGRGLPARRRQPRPRARARARRRLAGRPRQGLHHPNPHGFGLWVEQLLAESTGKEGKGLVPAPGESPDGPDRQAQRSSWTTRTSSARSSSAGSSRPRSPARSSGSTRSTSPTSRRRRTRRTRCSRGGDVELEPEGSVDELLAQAREPATTSRSRRSSTRRAEARARSRSSRAPATRPAASSRSASARATCTRPASCTRAAPTRLLPPGRRRHRRRAAIPGQPFGFGRLIRAQAAGDYAALKERGRPRRARPTWRSSTMQLGMVGLGRMGGEHDEAAARARPHGGDLRPAATESTAESLAELRDQLDAPRVVWLMIPAGESPRARSRSCSALLEDGDTIVDGGNSNFRDSQRRRRGGREEGHPLPRRRRLRRDLGPARTATA